MAWCRIVLAVFAIATISSVPAPAAEPTVDYDTQVKPLLKRCYACHSALRQRGGLRVDTVGGMKRGGDSGSAIVPGKGAESLILHAVAGTGEVSKMPPEDEAPPLTGPEIELLRRWIEQGASGTEESEPEGPSRHWAFQAPVRSPLPAVQESAWPQNPIDHFVLATLEARGLQHAPPASRAILLRRVHLDLVGIPPTPDELRSFINDDSPDAYSRVVARLLDSPQYGERWGRHWMDVWRYSDWAGYRDEIRESQYHIWRWRDWIVESLNADRPYDQMIHEMVAGDEVAPTDPEVLRATGYLGRNWFRYNRNVWLDNTVEHSGKAFLGLTFNCARCHDHKFDPISQDEYFQVRAIFEPYDVRYDRLPGSPDTTQVGIARVFDKRIGEPTFVFDRGNELTPDKDRPQPPRTPSFFALGYEPKPVPLPVEGFYPALTGFERDEARAAKVAQRAAAEEARRTAEEAVNVARRSAAANPESPSAESPSAESPSAESPSAESPSAESPSAENAETETEDDDAASLATEAAERSLHLASLHLDWATAELESFDRRLAAEQVKHGINTGDAEPLAKGASQAQRRAELLKAEHTVAELEHQIATLRDLPADEAAATPAGAEPKSQPAKTKKGKKKAAEVPKDREQQLKDLQTKLVTAVQARDAAQAKSTAESAEYAPLGEIYPRESTGRRSAFAAWITNERNPLTARVAANHIWLRHFGKPLVPTVFDFGLNGRPPSHPELLDWLAVELQSNGWRMKELHRLMVSSATYQQASSPADFASPPTRNEDLDPDNRLLWRMNSRRLEAEIVRDSLLFVAGSLDGRMGGPELAEDQGQSVARRSLYFRHAKEKEMMFTKLFDGPGVSECYQRDESVVPQQALALTNSPLAKTQSRHLAKELSAATSPGEPDAFVTAAYERILGRAPDAEELNLCRDFLASQASLLATPEKLTSASLGEVASVPAAADPVQRARENLVHVLFNHHEFVTVR